MDEYRAEGIHIKELSPTSSKELSGEASIKMFRITLPGLGQEDVFMLSRGDGSLMLSEFEVRGLLDWLKTIYDRKPS